MELRRSQRNIPRTQTSQEDLKDEQDTAVEERGQRVYPDLDVETDNDEAETPESEPIERKSCYFKSFGNTAKETMLGSPMFFILASIVIIVLVSHVAISECDKNNSTDICNDPLRELYKQCPKHGSLWKAVNVSFKMCTKSRNPGVALLLHNGDGRIAESLVKPTAFYLSKLIGVSKSGEYCWVDGTNADQTYKAGSFLKEIMDKRMDLGVVVFTNLEDMNLELVKNLHFICDVDPNISDTSIVILLLKVEVQSFKDIKSNALSDLAHNKIKQLWEAKLESTRFMPILGRITNNVGYIDESIPNNCKLNV